MRKLKPQILVLIASILLFSCCNVYALDNSAVSVSDATEIPALAEHTYQNANSPAIQSQLRKITETTAGINTPQNPEIAAPGDVLIFVSFSMPKESLKQWIAQAQRIQAPLIIRGLVNNSFAETQTKIAELMTDDQGGFVLEPRLFSIYHITQVPAVVVRNTMMTSCLATQNCPHRYSFDVVTGDVGLEAALRTVANQSNGSASSVARQALLIWRKTG